MKKMSIGNKNQIVIPKEIRDNVKSIRPGEKVMVYSLDDETIVIKVKNKAWIHSTYGSMNNALENIDPIKDIDMVRKEWI